MNQRWSLLVLFYFFLQSLVFGADWRQDVVNNIPEHVDIPSSPHIDIIPLNYSEKLLQIIQAKLAEKK